MARRFADFKEDSLFKARSIAPQSIAKSRSLKSIPIGVTGTDMGRVNDTSPVIGSHPYVLYNNIFCAMQSLENECGIISALNMLITEYLKHNSDFDNISVLWDNLLGNFINHASSALSTQGISILKLFEILNEGTSQLKGCFEIINQNEWRIDNCIKPCVSLSFSNHITGHFIAYSPQERSSGLGYLMEPAIGVIREIYTQELIYYSSVHQSRGRELLSLSDNFTEILYSLIHGYTHADECEGSTCFSGPLKEIRKLVTPRRFMRSITPGQSEQLGGYKIRKTKKRRNTKHKMRRNTIRRSNKRRSNKRRNTKRRSTKRRHSRIYR